MLSLIFAAPFRVPLALLPFAALSAWLSASVPRKRCAGSSRSYVADWKVRRLTPIECHRLQGFPDDYLGQVIHRGKPPADGPQYKALGNSMAVNVMRVIGERIAMVDALAGD